MNIRTTSAWNERQIENFLDLSVLPIRLGCIGEEGVPIVVSLWYQYDDGQLWCALHESSSTLRYLREHPSCGFEVAGDSPPYRGVRGQARVVIDKEQGVARLKALMARYGIEPDSKLAAFLHSRSAGEYAVALNPIWMTAWDYRERMEA